MSFIQWTDSMATDIDEIDTQHMQLVSLTNDLYEAMSKGQGKEKLNEIFNELFDYAKNHFFTEEKLMLVYAFPGYEEHKKEHQNFVEEIKKYKGKFEGGESKTSVEVAKFLKEWLVNHILKTDQQYTPYLKDKV
ncbi:MAG: bacteriohemerythrin [Bacteroidales bacterium]